jgi:DNA-binding NarL/FixJ family response regulator
MNYQLVRVDTREEFVRSLDDFKPDIVLSDHSLPQFNSLEALNICKSIARSTPFIMLTGAASQSIVAECMKNGARDCILKSEYRKVPRAIRSALEQS